MTGVLLWIPAFAGIHNGAARRGLLIERRRNLRLRKCLGFKQSFENCFIFVGLLTLIQVCIPTRERGNEEWVPAIPAKVSPVIPAKAGIHWVSQ